MTRHGDYEISRRRSDYRIDYHTMQRRATSMFPRAQLDDRGARARRVEQGRMGQGTARGEFHL